ncbi:hypothetical protein ACJIZ3_010520 [Penstemon smallii]|uniref:RING-type E3 ubiquitin transferase n=1 Tax=Penstemon smallii TaxID=265156 RepID=A0ABD3UJL7_9LAMI
MFLSWSLRKNVIRRHYKIVILYLVFVEFSPNFVINSTFIAEGSWDGKNNRVFIVACPILNSAINCTLRLSLRYPSVWTIINEGKVVGQIWNNRTLVKLTSTYGNEVLALPGLRYTYTKLDRVRQLCPLKKLEKSKKGNVYPDGSSNDMRFDLSVQNSNAWGYALPIFVGNEFYERTQVLVAMSPESGAQFATISEPEKSTSPIFNISYKIRIITTFPRINNSSNKRHVKVELNAEGVYNGETGHLCMVGCKKSNKSLDCEILVNFEFVPLNGKGGGLIKGTIRSMREKTDPLYFKDLSVSSTAFSQTAARKSIWRMDFEITMVLISNSLLCIFVGIQILHVKRNPNILSGISMFMLVILSIGLVTPLVLNFEAFFLDSHNEQRLWLNNGGWLEANEITIRLVTMVAFLLQIRLLQLVWTAKTSSWVGEKKAFFVTLPMYISGGLLTLLLNRTRNKNSLWNDLRSYSGLILDGFLFPQILLNVFRGSSEKALSHSFYVGSSLVRVVPHAYDQYRAHSYPRSYVNGTYYYANHSADFYSTAWDVVIPFGVIALAVIIFLQQRRGGRCIIPKRFRQELELYQKVAVVNNEQ